MTTIKTDIGAKDDAFHTRFAPTATISETDVQRAIQAAAALGAAKTIDYLIGTADVTLPNARIPTATTTISWDFATPNQAKANIVAASVSNALLANMAQSTVKGRAAGAGAGVPTDLTAAQVQAILGLATSSTDNAVTRFDGTAGGLQNSGLTIDDSNNISPTANDGGALGTAVLRWSDIFLASGAVININADWIATHTAGILTVGTGDFRVTNAGTNTASAVTVGGTQTLTSKQLTAATVNTSFTPTSNDGSALGTGALSFSDIFFASGGVANWANGDVTATHSTGKLAFGGTAGVFTSWTYTGADGNVPFTIDAGGSAITGSAAFLVVVPTTGAQKAFQLTFPGAIASWASFELNIGGTTKPGFAVGPGSAVRDTNLYRDSADTWKTDDSLIVVGTFTLGGVPVFSNIPQNSQSTAYTTILTDAQKHILHPAADNNARTFTIAANASVAYPVGTAITFANEINTVTISINTDTLTLAGAGTTGSRTLAANGIATALKITTTKWMISGTGLT